MKESKLRLLIILLALYCFALSLNIFYKVMVQDRITTDDCLWIPVKDTTAERIIYKITDIIPGGVADEAGIKEGDILLEINGLSFLSNEEASNILNSYSDETIRYTLLRNDETIFKDIYVYKFVNILFLIFWLLGTGFLFVGFIVGFSKPSELTSKLFFFLGCSASLGLLLYGNVKLYEFQYSSIFNNPTDLISFFFFLNHIVAIVLFQSLLFHFFSTFPNKYNFRGKRKSIIVLSYIIVPLPTALVIATNFFATRFYFNLGYFIVYILPAIIVTSGLILFFNSYRKIEDKQNKKPLKIIRNGMIIASAGALYFLIYLIFFSKPIFLVNRLLLLPVFSVLALPLTFGYSIIKYRILDTEYLIKRSLVFGIVSVIIIIIYLLLIYIMDSYLGGYARINRQYLIVGFIILVTFTFDYVNKKSKDFVDKIFYKERYNFRKSLLDFSHQLSYIKDVNEILTGIREEVSKSLGMQIMQIWLIDERYIKLVNRYNLPEDFEGEFNKIKIILKKLYDTRNEPVILSYAYYQENNLSDEETALIQKTGIILSIPLFIHNKLIGSLNFGAKGSGKAFSEEDLDLLRAISVQTAISLENYRLEKEELNKKKIEEELHIARKIQMGLLPEGSFENETLKISGLSIPAKIIGGDFFDIIKNEDNKLFTLVADVSGKGIPSAIYMSKAQSIIQFATTVLKNPRDILIEINKQIYEQIEKKYFITIILLMFDFNRNEVIVCSAGHLPMLLYRDKKAELINPKGIGLGIENGILFEKEITEFSIEIKPNDLYFIYSDGLTECFNENGEEFGIERCINTIKEKCEEEPEFIKKELLREVNAFMGSNEQHDDITFEIIKIK